MALPTPAQMQRQISLLKSLLADLNDEYQWAYDLAYAGNGRSLPEPGGTRNPAHVRPTEQTAVADSPARKQAAYAAERVEAMIRDVRSIVNTMMPRADRTSGHPDAFPRTITSEERKQLESAQRRRTERGDGWGRG